VDPQHGFGSGGAARVTEGPARGSTTTVFTLELNREAKRGYGGTTQRGDGGLSQVANES